MRKLETAKSRLIFETASTVRDAGKTRSVVIQAEPRYAIVGLKRTKQKFHIPWDAVWSLGAKIAAEETRKAKIAAKKEKHA